MSDMYFDLDISSGSRMSSQTCVRATPVFYLESELLSKTSLFSSESTSTLYFSRRATIHGFYFASLVEK